MIDDAYYWINAVVCENMGSGDLFAVKVMVRYLQSLGVEKVSLRSDSEEAIAAFVRRVCEDVPSASPQLTPVGSKGSLGMCERAHQTIQGLSRTMISQIEHEYDVKLGISHPIFEWVVRHAGWVHFTQAVNGPDRQTAFFRRFWQYLCVHAGPLR